ncbi:hypothetical protein HKD37_18G052280 [Glycine soja]
MHTSNLSSNSTWHITPGATRSVIYDAQFRFPRRWKHHIRRRVSASTGTKLSGDSSAKPLSFSGAIVDSIARFQFLILVDRVRRVLWCFLGHTVAICITQWVVAR